MLGEFDLIRAILSDNYKHRDLVVPNGDDAAVLRCGGQLVALSVDTIIEGSHFSLDYFTPRQIGMKGVESSLSDIVASVTSIGRIPSDEWIARRSGAKVGDLIYVTGALGGSAAGLHLFNSKIAGFERLKMKHVEPKCRVDLVNSIGLLATSMIDISDGLSSELYHICDASEVGCVVYEDQLPINLDTRELAAKSDLDPFRWAWNGGEDYELLFTCKPEDHAVAPGTLIGEVIEERAVLVVRGGTREKLVRGGYDHFGRG